MNNKKYVLKEKRNGKNKTKANFIKKKYKYIVLFLTFTIVFISMFQSSIPKAYSIDNDNYSEYLGNSPITISDDKAMLLKESADSGNSYRNYLENGFTIPSKLSNEMFSAYDSGNTAYSVSQSYLSNLDNEKNYKSNNESENIEQQIEASNYVMNNGSYLDTSIYNNTFYLKPNGDLNTDLTVFGEANHYEAIDESPYEYSSSYIELDGDNHDIGDYDEFELNISDYFVPDLEYQITIEFWYYREHISGYTGFNFTLYNTEFNSNDLEDGAGFYPIVPYSINNFSINSNTLTLEKNILKTQDNLKLKIEMCAESQYFFRIYNLHVKFESINYSTSLFESEKSNAESGLFPATYSFTNDADGSEPDGWVSFETGGGTCDIEVISDLDGHDKVLDINDKHNSYYGGIYKDIGEQATGTVEFWLYTPNNNDLAHIEISDGGSSDRLKMYFDYDPDKYGYITGSWIDIDTWDNNQWNHVRIEWDCSDDWHLWINGISKDGGSGYGYKGNPISMDQIMFFSNTQSYNYHFYLDAIGFSWDEDYDIGNNLNDTGYFINFESENTIEYLSNNNYKCVAYSFNTQILSNISGINYYVSIFNYDIESYFLMIKITDNSLKTFILNESSYFRFNKFKIKIYTNNYSSSFKSFFINLNLTLEYIKENDNGYQEINVKFKEYDSGLSYLGYFSLDVLIYSDIIKYRYIEISSGYSNYGGSWQTFNYSDNSINLQTLEILGQIRFGYNTLIQEITNIRFEIVLNNNEHNITIVEQNRIGSFDGRRYSHELNYTSHNRNYLNITGIIGNYSYVCLNGFRSLKGEVGEIYNRYFDIPRFYESINLQLQTTVIEQEIPNEPEPPTSHYWTYNTFRLISGSAFDTSVGNWSISFTPVAVEQYTAKYYYKPAVYKHSDFGSWHFKIGDWKVSFNFLRNAICDIINLVLVFFQFIFFLVVASLSYIFMFLGCYILAFLFNIVIYWIFIGLCWTIWWLYAGLILGLNGLLWLWRNVIIPFLEWVWKNIVPWVIDQVIKIFAHGITLLIYCITLGQINYWDTYAIVYELLWTVVRELYSWILTFIDNITYLLLFTIWYIICLVFLYLRYLYARARGFKEKAEKYYYTELFFFTPIRVILDFLQEGKKSTPIL